MSKMNRSGFMKPVSRRPPGRSTRDASCQTGARSGQNTVDTGLKTTSNSRSHAARLCATGSTTSLMPGFWHRDLGDFAPGSGCKVPKICQSDAAAGEEDGVVGGDVVAGGGVYCGAWAGLGGQHVPR